MNYILLALLFSALTYFMTALGSAFVFFFKEPKEKLLNVLLGFSSGIMLAASYFSLLKPALEQAATPFSVLTGFLIGFCALIVIDISVSKKNKGTAKRTFMLITSITLHNIPEGLSVGVAFGILKSIPLTYESIILPATVAIGIALQNLPEGAAVALPLRQEGFSRRKSFFYGQLSGMVEIPSALLGAYLVGIFTFLLPYALSFAAGAMIYVVIKELVPSQEKQGGYAPASACMIGFLIMMALDVLLS